MHVTQLLYALALGPHVEIVEARLPNVHGTGIPERTLTVSPLTAGPAQHALRVQLLYQLHHFGRVSFLRFTDQKKVLRHDDVAEDYETIAPANFFQDAHEQIATGFCVQPGFSVVTTTGYEVQSSGAVVSPEALGHEERVNAKPRERCDGAHTRPLQKTQGAGHPWFRGRQTIPDIHGGEGSATRRSPIPIQELGLLQLRILRLGCLQDRNVLVGVFPRGEEILIGSASFGGVTGKGKA